MIKQGMKYGLLAMLTGWFAPSCVAANDVLLEYEQGAYVLSPAQETILSSKALADRKLLAVKGDKSAAIDVASHYSNSSDGQDESRYWLAIAAENGSAIAMHLLSGELFREGGKLNCERAVFWLTRLLEQSKYIEGYGGSKFIEDEIAKIRSNDDSCGSLDINIRGGVSHPHFHGQVS